ncbi:MAG: tripartite tricarboxylate transporter TctB family protein [Pseudomonadota bacterium]
MLHRVPRDVWIGLAVIAGAGFYWLGADGIPISPLDGAVNAAAMPKALALALAVLGALLIIRSLSVEMMAARAGAAPAAAQSLSDEDRRANRIKHLRAAGVVVIGAGYLLIVTTVGYIISIAALITVLAFYIGAKADWRLPATALGIAVGFYVIFVQFLGIPLPPGILQALGV